ncbi:2'-5' RNA ligase family protein [Nocardia cyriacigeorgica]|uniref:2'-5' RNA ligase family protein n=1 Tax=Nocardia cyriacigeorgica TaxID=135487 RepID=A0A6P1D5J3_9NOCA|nr:2'-5' RNA ligase family protein [Nocardia cyriacigeorgica]NEW41566.1 2'-5' RNA ligase family protein [Nocardia cyriacigeorgica]NEW44163.1 2'-5' RNA ligase family protein [Nocardia cyriacigeorgica]
MVQSVELVLDDTAEEHIREQWAVLAEAGLPGVLRRPAAGDPPKRPHITVAVAKQIWPRIDHDLEKLPFRRFQVRLGGVLVFGARRPILVRLVVPTEELLACQRRVHALVSPCPGVPGNMHPDQWTPHVTLARRVPPPQLGEAVLAVAAERDFTATVVGIRRWDGDERRAWPVAGGR